MIATARARGFAPEQVICTGDVVAYCADAAATVDAIRDFGCTVVAGNCERQLASGADDCGCGFEAGSACDRLSAEWFVHASAQMTKAHRDWMAELPDLVVLDHAGRRSAVIHGGVADVARFIWPSSDAEVFAEEVAAITEQVTSRSGDRRALWYRICARRGGCELDQCGRDRDAAA